MMKAEKSDLFTCHFDNGEEGLFSAMSSAEQACLDHNIDPERVFLVNLCIEELVTNALRYGAEGRDCIRFDVSIDFSGPELVLGISDDANPFNPLTEAPSPDLDASIEDRRLGGLGIHLLKSMTISMQYERINDRNIVSIKI